MFPFPGDTWSRLWINWEKNMGSAGLIVLLNSRLRKLNTFARLLNQCCPARAHSTTICRSWRFVLVGICWSCLALDCSHTFQPRGKLPRRGRWSGCSLWANNGKAGKHLVLNRWRRSHQFERSLWRCSQCCYSLLVQHNWLSPWARWALIHSKKRSWSLGLGPVHVSSNKKQVLIGNGLCGSVQLFPQASSWPHWDIGKHSAHEHCPEMCNNAGAEAGQGWRTLTVSAPHRMKTMRPPPCELCSVDGKAVYPNFCEGSLIVQWVDCSITMSSCCSANHCMSSR